MHRIGEAVKRARKRAGLSQQDLADRIGSTRNAIQNLESRSGRRTNITVFDVVEIAAAVEVSPLQLLYPNLPVGEVEYVPGRVMPAVDAALTFSGERSLSGPPGRDVTVMQLARRWRELSELVPRLERELEASPLSADEHSALLGSRSKAAQLDHAREDLSGIEAALTDLIGEW